jgi:hypothetical protein
MDFPAAPRHSPQCVRQWRFAPGDYREIEYGHTPVTNDALAKLCEKYGLIEAELRAPPNYALLLDLPTRKLIEYSRVALTPRQRKSLIFMLRDFLPKRY